MSHLPPPVWDLPTRLFHWCLPLLLVASWCTHKWDAMRLHSWCGYTMLVLVMFRIVWGFAGSTHARFADFVRGPRAVWRHLRGGARRARAGHNPAGGWSVLAMLALLLAQALSGLFNRDDVAFAGPLAHLVTQRWSERLGAWHDLNFDLLLALVGVHVLVVLLYQRRGDDLLRPMLRGGRAPDPVRTTPAWVALLLLAACAGALWLALALVPQPEIFL